MIGLTGPLSYRAERTKIYSVIKSDLDFIFLIVYFSERHFWPFSEINKESNAYKDVSNDYDLTAKLYSSPITPGKVLTFNEDKQFIMKTGLLDDCLADPELCRRTGLTIGLWLKRKGKLYREHSDLASFKGIMSFS